MTRELTHEQSDLLKKAASLAGLSISSVQSDSNMAAFHYGSLQELGKNKTFLILDFGHSKTSLTFAKYESTGSQRIIYIESSQNIPFSGKVVDENLAELLLENTDAKVKFTELNPIQRVHLLKNAQKLKEILTSNDEIEFFSDELPDLDNISGQFTRSSLETKMKSVLIDLKNSINEFIAKNNITIVYKFACNM